MHHVSATALFFFLLLTTGNFDVEVCKKWRTLASENTLWSTLFKERWGTDCATFYAPIDSRTWKDVYAVQDRCDRFGVGLKIIREGEDYFLVHQGEIQRHLGRRRPRTAGIDSSSEAGEAHNRLAGDEHCSSILDQIIFFIGDVEAASTHAKRICR